MEPYLQDTGAVVNWSAMNSLLKSLSRELY
nr:MAG TPA: hypothetical protein [Caudoviricetes sp.]